MREDLQKYLAFRNRLAKVYKHRAKLAAKQNISCFRIYDHDLPEAPFCIEQYGDHLLMWEYERKHRMSEAEHEAWLWESKKVVAEVTGVAEAEIYLRTRKRKEGRQDQYQKIEAGQKEIIVQEGGLKFIMNLTDYLDSGLFLDHRITRGMVRGWSGGMRVLNLFCYTGSFSVYAKDGGALEVMSVDLSNTYLQWAQRNMELNFGEKSNAVFLPKDVLSYLPTLPQKSFDLIILDPPTFSNSKRMESHFDVQQHHHYLLKHCLRILAPGGKIIFSTNFTKFHLNTSGLAAKVEDITKRTTPFDFEGKLQRPCFLITH